jgi:hypothetical protein
MDLLPPTSPDVAAYPSVYRHLMRVGLLGIVYRFAEDARIVNNAVEATLEDAQAYHLVVAVAHGMAGRPESGRHLLGLGPHDDPQDDQTKLALAVTQLLGGDPQWRYWIDQVLACSVDQPARQTAYGVLGFVRRLH